MPPELVELVDAASGSRARVLAGHGFNCFSFEAAQGGRLREVLWASPAFASGQERPSRSGIPLLFPFAGRIFGGEFSFEGRTFRVPAALAAADDHGTPIHGYALNRPWEVIERSAARVVGRFQASRGEPGLVEAWPGDYALTVSYEVRGPRLASVLRVHNPGPGRLPFGLGTHGYLRPPVDRPEDSGAAIVRVPVGQSWEMEALRPTGRRTSGTLERDLAAGLPLDETKLDNVFGGLTFERGWCTASLTDPASGRAVKIAWDEAFPTCVVFNPPHREAICIEPYTTVPDAFRLQAEGIKAGLRVLEPGGEFVGRVEIWLE
jgi:aldose 1-epimerase